MPRSIKFKSEETDTQKYSRKPSEKKGSEYRQAIQTNDNTQGAVNEARLYLQKPYTRPDNE